MPYIMLNTLYLPTKIIRNDDKYLIKCYLFTYTKFVENTS